MDAQGAGPEGAARLIGRVIGGYRLVRVLGTEGASAVLLGEHVDAPEQHAAIAILLPPNEASAQARGELRAAFARQAQTLFALQHPHIHGIYAYGVDVVGGNPYMVLPYLDGGDGGTLAARLAAGPLPLAAAAHILTQLADALDAAHALGITHGDLRPATILLDEDEHVYLAGIGVPWPSDAAAGPSAASNAAYMAPERAHGETASAASDLYSLGVVLYEMVTGYVPFQGATPAIILLQHAQLPPPPPRALRPELPQAAEAVMLRALAKHSSARFPSAAALVEAFARGLAGKSMPEPERLAVEAPADMVESDMVESPSVEPAEAASPAPAVTIDLEAAEPDEIEAELPISDSATQVYSPDDEPATPIVLHTADQPAESGSGQEDGLSRLGVAEPDEERDTASAAAPEEARPIPPPEPPRDAPRSVPVVTRPAATRPAEAANLATVRESAGHHHPESSPVTGAGGSQAAAEEPQLPVDVAARSEPSSADGAAAGLNEASIISPVMVRNVMLALFALGVGGAAIAVLRFLGAAEFALMAVIIGLFVWLGVLLPRRWEGGVKGQSAFEAKRGAISRAPSR